MNARALLVLTCLAVTTFAGCTCGAPDITADGGADAGGPDAGPLDPFSAFREVRSAVRASADHRPARADAVVASRDVRQIFEFVRDEIATYPPDEEGFSGATSSRRWGTKATLRGGAGTPREKAELLVSLLQRAGFTASVVQGTLDARRVDAGTILFRDTARPFTFAPSAQQSARWRAALGGEAIPRTSIDPDGSQAAALAASLEALTPGDLTAPFDLGLPAMPLVRITLDGGAVYANPLVPDAGLGDPVTLATPTPTGAAGSLPQVRVTLEAARADAPYSRFELLDATYDVEDVVGRRIQLAFVPPGPLERVLTTRMRDVTAVVPVVSVVGPDVSPAEKVDLARVGDLLTFAGDVYELTADGGVSVNGAEPLGGSGDPSRVATVQVSASGAAFPQVTLEVGLLDGAGASVPRLPASAFTVTEEGAPVSFTLQRNQRDPSVVLLFDLSGSIPAEFRGAGAVSVADQIVTQLYAVAPSARVRIGYVSFGTDFVSSAWATTLTEARAQAALLATASGGSELWEALLDATELDPTSIILVTDGDATDTASPRATAALSAGPPVLSIGVGPVVQATLDEISRLSGGRSVSATMASTATAAAAAELEARVRTQYRLTYRAPVAGPSTRQVRVTVNGRFATDPYAVPAMPAPEAALSGLYLTISTGARSHTVTLAGFERGFSTAFPVVTAAMKEEVRAMLRGRVSVSVEGAAPSPSVVLDDWITQKLSLEPMFAALASGDGAALRAALTAGVETGSGPLALAQGARLPGAVRTDSLTFETSVRLATMIEKIFDGGPVTRQLDLFPQSRWATAAADPRLAWRRTFEATAGLGIIEARMLAGPSTQEALAGVSLSYLSPLEVRSQPGLTAEEELRWAGLVDEFPGGDYRLLAPLRPGAFWAVHRPTGTLVGVLPDGTGGGAEDACTTFDLANAYANGFGLLGGFFGVPGLGAWVALAQWEIKYVTVAILVLEGAGGPVDLTNPAAEMACGMANEAAGGALPSYGVADTLSGTYSTVNPDHALPSVCGTLLGGGDGPCH